MDKNTPISEQYHKAAIEYADLHAAASLLEETKSAVLSQMMIRQKEQTVSRAEMHVKASPEWEDYIKKMVAARKAANKAKARLDYLKMRHWEWQSEAATERTQARL